MKQNERYYEEIRLIMKTLNYKNKEIEVFISKLREIWSKINER